MKLLPILFCASLGATSVHTAEGALKAVALRTEHLIDDDSRVSPQVTAGNLNKTTSPTSRCQ